MALIAGCLGHCGPTLDGLTLKAHFAQGFTQENRTAAREALLRLGFNETDAQGPGGFFVSKADVSIFVGGAAERTSWDYELDVPDRESSSDDRLRAYGASYEPRAWSDFNQTLGAFEHETRWHAERPTHVEHQVYVC